MMDEFRKYRFQSEASYRLALAAKPNANWITERSVGHGKSRYIPIAIVESTADIFFSPWYVMDERYFNSQNEMCCTVKIYGVPDYNGSEAIVFTGSAATPIQQKSGTSVADFEDEKKPNALQYNMPKVRAAAISNAFATLGNIFGRNLNREGFGDDYGLKSLKFLEGEGQQVVGNAEPVDLMVKDFQITSPGTGNPHLQHPPATSKESQETPPDQELKVGNLPF